MKLLFQFTTAATISFAVFCSVAKTEPSSDDRLTRNKAALEIIRDFADSFCKTVPLSGKNEAVEISGEAKADLGGMVKKLADMGFQGAAKYTKEEWQGPLRDNLATLIKENNECRRDVWRDLQLKLLSSVDNKIQESSIPLEDAEVYGILRPANEITPLNGCDGRKIGENSLKVLIGDNAITHEGLGSFTAVGIGNCDAISMTRTEEGVFINASLFDREGQGVVSINENRIIALNGDNYITRQSRDRSRLTVKTPHGKELFYIRYLNPTTIQFRGFLGCNGGNVVQVQDGQPVPGFFMTRSCLSNARTGIQIGAR